MEFLSQLLEGGYIQDKDRHEPKIATPKGPALKIFSPPKPAAANSQTEEELGDLDFHSGFVHQPAAPEMDAQHKAEEAARQRAEMEAAVEIAKQRADQEAQAKAEAKAKQEAEKLARERALAEAEEARKAEAKARLDAEAAARAAKTAAEEKQRQEAALRAQMEAKLKREAEAAAEKAKQEAIQRAQLEAKAKLEAELRAQAEEKARKELDARLKEEQEKARAKAAIEDALKARAEIEAAAKVKQAAEARARQEAEAVRLKAEQEAERVKAELAAAAKAKAEMEAALLHAEQEAARIRIEMEAAKAKAEAEAKAAEEARRKQREEEKALQAAELARMKAEQEAAIARAVAEEIARKDAEQKAKLEAEAARLKAEQEAAIARAVAEAEAKARKEAEQRAMQEAEAARRKAEQETAARLQAEERMRKEAEQRAQMEAEAARLKAEQEMTARLLAEERLKKEVEQKALAEAEAARLRVEQEGALARSRAEAEEKTRMEVARLKTEQEAAQARQEEEIAARLRAEAEARVNAEVRAKQMELEAAKRIAEEQIRLAAEREVQQNLSQASAQSGGDFEIELDSLMQKLESPTFVQPDSRPVASTPTAQEPKPVNESAVKSPIETIATQDLAAEMARLKREADAAKRAAEEQARRMAEEQALAEEQAKAWAEAEHRAKAQALVELEQAAQQAAVSQAKVAAPAVARKQKIPLPWGKIISALVVLALIAIIVLPYVYPLNDYVAPLEQRLSVILKKPVHVGVLSASTLPPRLQLKDVAIGNAQEIKIASVTLSFNPLSLFSASKTISNVEIQSATIQSVQFDKQLAGLNQLGGNAEYPIRHVTLKDIKVATDDLPLPLLSGIVECDAQGSFNRLTVHSNDDKLDVDLQLNQGKWQVLFNLRESALPVLPGVTFSELGAKGDINDGEINFTEWDARFFDGLLLGTAKLNWRKGWQLQGHFEAKTFALNKMFAKYHLEGDLNGEGSFNMTGAKLSQLDDAPHLDGSFNVKDGTVGGFDMVETARLQSRENLVGGRTHFDQLNGLVQYDNHVTTFKQVKVASSTMSASGSFDVSATDQVNGSFNTDIKMRDGSTLLKLYGTAAEPKMRTGG